MTTQKGETWTEPVPVAAAPDSLIIALLIALVARKAGKRIQIAKAELDALEGMKQLRLKVRMNDELQIAEIFIDD